MIRINFVCYGNICRSPMAEFLFKKLLKDKGVDKDFFVCSSATSTEELHHKVHYGTARILDRYGIDYSSKRAEQVKKSDYENFDYFICMEEYNAIALRRIFGGDKDNKIKLLLSFASDNRDVIDPYYSGDFEATHRDVKKGLDALYEFLVKEHGV